MAVRRRKSEQDQTGENVPDRSFIRSLPDIVSEISLGFLD